MNKNTTSIACDVAVIGSGFSGSLTALCLHQSGLNVCVIEKDRHPRFAIGESSTPIADMILRDLSDAYDLPWLKHFSRYGSWQHHYPEITCGLKRGFSYFKHKPGAPFKTNASHKNELLVAASVNDEQSDTNWLRSDFDTFLVKKLHEYGIPYFDKTDITAVKKNKNWQITAENNQINLDIEAGFIVDATGNTRFLNKFLGIESTSDGFKTHSKALFSHFKEVTPWKIHLNKYDISTGDFPYNPDHSALHHLLNDGWMWMLRFNDDRTSAGFLLNTDPSKGFKTKSPAAKWESLLVEYPSLDNVFRKAVPAEEPGRIIETGRLQRRLLKAAGCKWAALPHTAGFVDPMHSTGIAHTLSGIEKLVSLLSGSYNTDDIIAKKLDKYEQSIFLELDLIDLLVAGSYKSLYHFELFIPYVMLYFAAAINYEQKRLNGEIPTHFLCADDPQINEIIRQSYSDLKAITEGNPSWNKISRFRKAVKNRISPFNSVGLLDPKAKNMYRHTAVNI